MSRPGRLVVYVTSHGFGHLNRAAAVLNRLPFDLPVTIRADASLFEHWRERLRRPADLEPYSSDIGAVNPPGDSAATDGPATIARAMARHAEALATLDAEVERLRQLEPAAVLVDVPPLPILAAQRAGVPVFAIGNFTWADIYAEHAPACGPAAMQFVDELRACYGLVTTFFRAQPGLPMRQLPNAIDVGMVVTPGRDRGAELRQWIGVEPSAKLAYFYVGRYGQETMDWGRLAGLRDIHFVSFHPAPVGPLPNLHVVPPDNWNGTDLIASTDAAVAKAGYMTVCEAMAAGTPMIYPPRTGFAEHEWLDAGLRAWGGGVPATVAQFDSLDLEPLLRKALALRPGSPPFHADGAGRIADRLERECRAVAS